MAVCVGVARDKTMLTKIDGGWCESGGHIIVVEQGRCCQGSDGSGGMDHRNLTWQEQRGTRVGDIEPGQRETLNERVKVLECGAGS